MELEVSSSFAVAAVQAMTIYEVLSIVFMTIVCAKWLSLVLKNRKMAQKGKKVPGQRSVVLNSLYLQGLCIVTLYLTYCLALTQFTSFESESSADCTQLATAVVALYFTSTFFLYCYLAYRAYLMIKALEKLSDYSEGRMRWVTLIWKFVKLVTVPAVVIPYASLIHFCDGYVFDARDLEASNQTSSAEGVLTVCTLLVPKGLAAMNLSYGLSCVSIFGVLFHLMLLEVISISLEVPGSGGAMGQYVKAARSNRKLCAIMIISKFFSMSYIFFATFAFDENEPLSAVFPSLTNLLGGIDMQVMALCLILLNKSMWFGNGARVASSSSFK